MHTCSATVPVCDKHQAPDHLRAGAYGEPTERGGCGHAEPNVAICVSGDGESEVDVVVWIGEGIGRGSVVNW